MTENWRKYEDVARVLLMHLKNELGLTRVEGKQKLVGSGTEWEVDAKGVGTEEEAFVIVECRRYTSSGVTQEQVGGLAFRLLDTGAKGGIIVSPLPLQKGAQRLAAATNIVHVEIDANSTPDNFAMRFLNRLFLGVKVSTGARAEVTMTTSRVCGECGEKFEPVASEARCPACA